MFFYELSVRQTVEIHGLYRDYFPVGGTPKNVP
jgi:hypothetical protein